MKSTTKFTGAAALLVLGLGTVTLFQNCSSGSTPSDLSTASAVPLPTTNPPLLMYPAATSVTAGGTVLLTVSGGSAGYQFTATGGSVTSDPLAGFIYNAPSVVGSYVITVTDSSAATYTTTMNVTAAQATTQPRLLPRPKTIYRFYNNQTQQHAFSDVQNVRQQQRRCAVPAGLGRIVGRRAVFNRCAYVPQADARRPLFSTTPTQASAKATRRPQRRLDLFTRARPKRNTQPLYRFRLEFTSAYGDQRGFAVDHIDSDQPGASRLRLDQESVLGYVPTK